MLKDEKIIVNRLKDLKMQKIIIIKNKKLIYLSPIGLKSGFFLNLIQKIFKINVEG